MPELIHTDRISTPVGPLHLYASGAGLMLITFGNRRRSFTSRWLARHCPNGTFVLRRSRALITAARQLREYFAGKRRRFTIPLDLRINGFHAMSLNQVQQIGFGKFSTYGAMARRLGMPHAARAVGAANGANPLPIVIGCHRLVGADGRLTGFGGGLDAKKWLLEHEGVAVNGMRVESSNDRGASKWQ